MLAALAILALTRPGAPPAPPTQAPLAEQAGTPQPSAPPAARAERAESRVGAEAQGPIPQKSAATDAAAPLPGGPAMLVFKIAPPGEPAEVFIDGRKVGTSPGLVEYGLSPGKHKVEIHGNRMPMVHHFWVNLKPGEKKKIWARFADDS